MLLMAATGAADAHDAGFVVAVDGSRRVADASDAGFEGG